MLSDWTIPVHRIGRAASTSPRWRAPPPTWCARCTSSSTPSCGGCSSPGMTSRCRRGCATSPRRPGSTSTSSPTRAVTPPTCTTGSTSCGRRTPSSTTRPRRSRRRPRWPRTATAWPRSRSPPCRGRRCRRRAGDGAAEAQARAAGRRPLGKVNRGADIRCLEGDPDYDVTLALARRQAQVRAHLCLPGQERGPQPALGAAARCSRRSSTSCSSTTAPTTAHPSVARQIAERCGATDRYTGTSYPWQVSRAGAEHLATPPDSVHSLTHFYNWSFAHVRTAYSMKWDGDMVLDRARASTCSPTCPGSSRTPARWSRSRGTRCRIESESVAWIDLGFRFLEPWVYPMGPEFTFVKAFEWEVREFPATSERIIAPEGLCVELKWLDSDEFAHWTAAEAFEAVRVLAQASRACGLRAPCRWPGRGDPGAGTHRGAARRPRHRLRHRHLAAAAAAPLVRSRRAGWRSEW